MLGDFERAWSLILEFIQNAALSKNGEVSLAALKSLQEIMYHNTTERAERSLKDPQTAQEQDEEIWTVSSAGTKQRSPPTWLYYNSFTGLCYLC
ncbi:hypothetical protein M5D96_003817 [Drosophila gunungcola]|uniref:Mon2 C-terminal domain-containing protein n=1 Tax=Drosophila gunungcola TaxID=103775 RepID=A0A9P9YST1_9MUSC|nr:hypothetical protein M5D96_003817 [Drosophila gunungcola]